MLSQARKYLAFRRALSQLLSSPFSPAACEAIIRERLARREENFLYLIKHAVYGNPQSPYRLLLRDAGISFEDIRKRVQQGGVEETLMMLRDSGVYLTFEEYKGREPIVRRGKTYLLNPEDLHVLQGSDVLDRYTGGSTGPAVRVPQSLSFQREHAIHTGLLLAFWLPPKSRLGLWRSEPPTVNINTLIRFSLIGYPPTAWFTPTLEEPIWRSWQGRLLLRTTRQILRKRGILIPALQYVPLMEAHRIVDWIVEQKRSGAISLINCNVSNAVRMCEAAKQRGQDIRGTRFFMISEPLTEAKRAEIEAVGGVPLSVYSAVDAGRLAISCENPSCADDMHVCTDSVAIITRRRPRPGYEESVDAFLITTLLPANPLFLLNVEFDDFGVLEERECGCRLAQLGLVPHINRVRSFAKLTTYGTTVPLADIAWVIEKTLPQHFGGSSIHYQLLEEEDLGSQTRLTLLVSPAVGPLDERVVLQTFLSELREADERLVQPTRLWEESGALHVVRAEPLLTPRGKLMPVRVLRDYEHVQLASS
jgi:hypothetical protein